MALYTDKDVSSILKRAAELQARQEGTAATGLTADELKSIAREVGVDPRFVEQALRESVQAPPEDDGQTYFWGGPMRVQAERIVPGGITEEMWEALVREARRTFGQTGKTDEVGHSREWRYDVLTSTMGLVSASPRRGQTVLHAERRTDNEAVLALLLPLMTVLTGGLLAALFGGVVGLFVSLAVFVLTFFASRALFGRLTRTRRKDLHEMLARIEQAADLAGTATATTTPITAPRLSLPDEAPPEADASEASRTRTT